jgi:hypothetical protein
MDVGIWPNRNHAITAPVSKPPASNNQGREELTRSGGSVRNCEGKPTRSLALAWRASRSRSI